MKKAAYTCILTLACIVYFTSCRKEYHCHCMYNNTLMASYDLGNHTKKDAGTICSRHDTDRAGEIWTCTLY